MGRVIGGLCQGFKEGSVWALPVWWLLCIISREPDNSTWRCQPPPLINPRDGDDDHDDDVVVWSFCIETLHHDDVVVVVDDDDQLGWLVAMGEES